jgi:uncharacterized protein YuzE
MSGMYHQTIKGIYQYPQLGDFISLKNYIFLWQGDKRCLLLRFVNNFEYEINELEYTITQIDAKGKVIGISTVNHANTLIRPGSVYTPNKALVADEACVDFRININKVRSGEYTYRVVDQHKVAYYPKPEKAFLDGAEQKVAQEINTFSESKRRVGKPRLVNLIAILSLILMVVFNVLYVLSPYIDIDWKGIFGSKDKDAKKSEAPEAQETSTAEYDNG